MGPGITAGIQLPQLGTQVDLAPTWLELAGIETPDCFDGKSILKFLVPDQDGLLPATYALLQRLRSQNSSRARSEWRNESFFQYYDAGPWAPANGGDSCHICTAGKGTTRPFDGDSNTYIGLYVDDPSLGLLFRANPSTGTSAGRYKYAEFQNECTTEQLLSVPPSCFTNLTTRELFDLNADEHELNNIAFTPEAKELVAELHNRLWRHYGCRGRECP